MRSLMVAVIASLLIDGSAFADKPKDSTDGAQKDADRQASDLGQHKKMGQPPEANTHPDAQWFPKAGIGLFIHWGIASEWGEGHISWGTLYNHGFTGGTITPNDYYALIEKWNPEKMDFDKMLGAAKAAGFRYAVFTTKHHDGFTHWPSAYGELGTKRAFDGRDFVKEYVEACRKHGLKVGFYYSPPDWYSEGKHRNWSRRGESRDMDHKRVEKGGVPRPPRDFGEKKLQMIRGHLTELLTNYGKIDLMWFDGGHAEMSNSEVRKLQPGIVINSRNHDPRDAGDYQDTEGGLTGEAPNGWFESCVCCWPIGAWNDMKESIQAEADLPLTMLSVMRGLGANVLINVGPKGDGSLREETLAAWKDMAEWMEHSAEAVHDVSPGPWPSEKVNLPVTTRGKEIAYVHFTPNLPQRFSNIPEWMKTKFNSPRGIVGKLLPAYTNTFTWQGVDKPKSVTLLRTGQAVDFTWENKNLTVTLPESSRSKLVDVVKLQW